MSNSYSSYQHTARDGSNPAATAKLALHSRAVEAAAGYYRAHPNATGTAMAFEVLRAHGGALTSGAVIQLVVSACERAAESNLGTWIISEQAVRSGLRQLAKEGRAVRLLGDDGKWRWIAAATG